MGSYSPRAPPSPPPPSPASSTWFISPGHPPSCTTRILPITRRYIIRTLVQAFNFPSSRFQPPPPFPSKIQAIAYSLARLAESHMACPSSETGFCRPPRVRVDVIAETAQLPTFNLPPLSGPEFSITSPDHMKHFDTVSSAPALFVKCCWKSPELYANRKTTPRQFPSPQRNRDPYLSFRPRNRTRINWGYQNPPFDKLTPLPCVPARDDGFRPVDQDRWSDHFLLHQNHFPSNAPVISTPVLVGCLVIVVKYGFGFEGNRSRK